MNVSYTEGCVTDIRDGVATLVQESKRNELSKRNRIYANRTHHESKASIIIYAGWPGTTKEDANAQQGVRFGDFDRPHRLQDSHEAERFHPKAQYVRDTCSEAPWHASRILYQNGQRNDPCGNNSMPKCEHELTIIRITILIQSVDAIINFRTTQTGK
jgi:hypothetical protein